MPRGTKRSSEGESDHSQKNEKNQKTDHEEWQGVEGSVCHIDIPVKNLERAKKFYSTAFGWNFNDAMPGYSLWMYKGQKPRSPLPGTVCGGLHEQKDHVPHKGVILHLWMSTVTEGVQRAKDAGGEIVKEAFEISPEIGWNAFVRDTEGNEIGIYSKKK